VADDILSNYQHVIKTFALITGSGGAFEFKINGELLYSKKTLKRHANPGEILSLFEAYVGPGTPRFEG